MTLVITEISKYGIVMVADSAVTFREMSPSGIEEKYVLFGARKLQLVPHLRAGISCWGEGAIKCQEDSVSTAIWLQDFIENNQDTTSLLEFATRLATELQSCFENRKHAVGFHLAGYEEVDDVPKPTLYHVRNVEIRPDSSEPEFHPFEPIQENVRLLRNGDHRPYAALFDAVERLVLPRISEIFQERSMVIPANSLEGLIAYHAAWVRFVSGLYASSLKEPTIGGEISVLGILPNGSLLQYPRV